MGKANENVVRGPWTRTWTNHLDSARPIFFGKWINKYSALDCCQEKQIYCFHWPASQKTWTAQLCLRRFCSTHSFNQFCWKNGISTFVAKFIAICHVAIHTHSIFCTLLLLICSRPGQNLWYAAKTQPQSDLANTCHMFCQESAWSSDFMIQAGRPHTKLTCCSQLLKKEMGKTPKQSTKQKAPQPYNLMVFLTLQHSRLGCSGTAMP